MNFSFGGKGIDTSSKFCKPITNAVEKKKSKKEIEEEKQKLKLEKLKVVEKWAKSYLESYLNENNSDTNDNNNNSTSKKKSLWDGYDIAMVQEIKCFIPGCAPIEVCIVFSKEGSTSKTGKIFKPVIDCSEDDVKEFITNFCNSTSPSDDDNVNTKNNSPSSTGGVNQTNEDHPFRCPCCDPDIKNFDRMLNGKEAFLDAGW